MTDYQMNLCEEECCYQCNKMFSYNPAHAYRYKFQYMVKGVKYERWYCSWSCYHKGKISQVLEKEHYSYKDILFLHAEKQKVDIDKVPKYLQREVFDLL